MFYLSICFVSFALLFLLACICLFVVFFSCWMIWFILLSGSLLHWILAELL